VDGAGSPVQDACVAALLGTILSIWAHPDDETYLAAGLMAQAVRDRGRVVCVTATRGEEGSFDEERWPSATMGKVREAELERCLKILGVEDHRWLDYRDGTLESVDPAEAVERIVSLFEEVRPATVLTFGPEGMTDHPDHKCISAWVGEAFARAAETGTKLFHATTTPEWAAEFVPRMNRFNVFYTPETPPITPRDEIELLFTLPPDLRELKMRAIEAHESQVEGMLNAFGEDFFLESFKEETFRLATEA
jgi:LmbE family N-acetylglucosaminyl deacetylase